MDCKKMRVSECNDPEIHIAGGAFTQYLQIFRTSLVVRIGESIIPGKIEARARHYETINLHLIHSMKGQHSEVYSQTVEEGSAPRSHRAMNPFRTMAGEEELTDRGLDSGEWGILYLRSRLLKFIGPYEVFDATGSGMLTNLEEYYFISELALGPYPDDRPNWSDRGL